MSAEERFWSKVVIVDDDTSCWEWRGWCDKDGYGNVRRGAGLKRTHRVAYQLVYGEIPEGLFVLHHCDNPPCVRPEHLFLGTHQDNIADKVAKNRQAQGDTHGSRLHPEKLAWGDTNGSRLHPEKLARGDANGSRKHPERLVRGAAVNTAKLNEHIVREICFLYSTGEWTQEELGRRFGVGQTTISAIIRRKNWKHL